VAVYGVLMDRQRVLLMRRAGSGYHDGELSLPAGHLDGDEDAISGLRRELREEITVTVRPGDCQLATVLHRRREAPDDHEYVDLFFEVRRWSGVPSIGEPGQCSQLCWADIDDLPGDTIGYVAGALRAVRTGQRLAVVGWDAG
jgi:ADP-ribose pyrophosphatase YjhB (NUDIX family)